jgi:polyhydroxyalkanoate synthesis regulator phasin
MTFGKVKTIIENNLIDSYKNEKEFKKSLREFKHNVLENKNLSKIYSLYDQLSDSQGLSEEDAKEFIQEGVQLIQKLLQNVKLPITLKESSNNSYSDIDTLVYDTKINLKERIEAKKNLIKVLTSKKEKVKESINIPIKSMVSIANQTLNTFISSLDETAKKEFFFTYDRNIKYQPENV